MKLLDKLFKELKVVHPPKAKRSNLTMVDNVTAPGGTNPWYAALPRWCTSLQLAPYSLQKLDQILLAGGLQSLGLLHHIKVTKLKAKIQTGQKACTCTGEWAWEKHTS